MPSSMWDEYEMEQKVLQILQAVPAHHHLGRPYMTSYQIAIEFDHEFPDAANEIGKPIGGAGTEQRNSLAQYLALELSRRIKAAKGMFPIEGALLANKHAKEIVYRDGGGGEHKSSLISAGYDMAIFRAV